MTRFPIVSEFYLKKKKKGPHQGRLPQTQQRPICVFACFGESRFLPEALQNC